MAAAPLRSQAANPAVKSNESWAAYRTHSFAFSAARDMCDRLWSDERLLPESEKAAFQHAYRLTVALSATNAAGLFGLLSGAVVTSVSKRIRFVEKHVLPRRPAAALAAACTAAAFVASRAGSMGIADGVYGALLGSDTPMGREMRSAYASVYPDSPFLAVARNVATTPAGRPDAGMGLRVGRYTAMLPCIPDPTGATSLAVRIGTIKDRLPPELMPSKLYAFQLAAPADASSSSTSAAANGAGAGRAIRGQTAGASTPKQGNRAAPKPPSIPVPAGQEFSREWDPYAPASLGLQEEVWQDQGQDEDGEGRGFVEGSGSAGGAGAGYDDVRWNATQEQDGSGAATVASSRRQHPSSSAPTAGTAGTIVEREGQGYGQELEALLDPWAGGAQDGQGSKDTRNRGTHSPRDPHSRYDGPSDTQEKELPSWEARRRRRQAMHAQTGAGK